MFPGPLKIGDKVAIVSPAGKIDVHLIDEAKLMLESWGLKVVEGISARSAYGRFAGTDEERLHDLQWALDDEEVRAIFCSRGGYGLVRLADKINLQRFKDKPKWVIGYSDVTVLHAIIGQTGVASLHAPMCSHFSREKEDEAVNYLKSLIFGSFPEYHLPSHSGNIKGTCSGSLKGGNLSILTSLRNTPYDMVPDHTVLFVEDIGEEPYRIERMFYNLYLSGFLQKLSGLIVGQFTECVEDNTMDKSIYESVSGLVSGYDYPVCFGFPVGHVKENYPMICGANVVLEVEPDEVVLNFLNR